MANSYQTVVSDGTLATVDVSIGYLDRADVFVYFNGVLQTTGWSWVGETEKRITFSPAVPNGVTVLIRRITSLAELRHAFSLGSYFGPDELDEDLLQVLYSAQEASESPQSVALNVLRFPANEVANQLPDAVARGNKAPVFDASGQIQLVDYFDSATGLGAILASQNGGEGASRIGVQDAGGHFTGANVEAALAEIALRANNVEEVLAEIAMRAY